MGTRQQQHHHLKDVRRFGRIALVKKGDYSQIPTLRDMGPEPFFTRFNQRRFVAQNQGRKQRIKTQLLSQRVIAGVGNIYADEALFYAGINPSVRSITRSSRKTSSELQMVFSQAIEKGGTTLRDYRNLDGAGSNRTISIATDDQACPAISVALSSGPE